MLQESIVLVARFFGEASMCMICRGLNNNKLSLQEAIEKYEEFLDLDLLDEEHQEIVEELIAEAEEEEFYWSYAKRDALRKDLEDEDIFEDENLLIQDDITLEDDEEYDD